MPAEITDKISTLLAEGATLAEVANQLTQDRASLPSGREGVWQATQVRRILRPDAIRCLSEER